MKKIVTTMIVLSLASFANAGLALSAIADPNLSPSHYIISISGDGTTDPGLFYMGVDVGNTGFLTIDSAQILYTGSSTDISWTDSQANAALLSIKNPFVSVELNDLPAPTIPKKPLDGLLVDNIKFQGTAHFTVTLFDNNGVPLAAVPEPVTMALLGLGGLFIRRKMA